MRAAYFLPLLLTLATVAWPQDNPASVSTIRSELDHVARVGSVMVDGDICQKIVTPKAKDFMFNEDPHNRFLDGDNYDVDDEAFNTTKKTLIRVSHLTSFSSDVNLWMPIEGHPGKIGIVVRNKNEMSQFWRWGTVSQDMIPQMATVLKTGQRITVMDRPGWISVLAPFTTAWAISWD
jgi:hypothetical protein